MVIAIKNEYILFKTFIKNNIPLIVFLIATILIVYGIKLFWFDYGIDSEHAISNYKDILKEWLSLNRFGLVLIKLIFFPNIFNLYIQNILSYVILGILSLLSCYSVARVSNNLFNKRFYYIFIGLFISSPIIIEHLTFSIQSFEVLMGSVLILISACLVLIGYYKKQLIPLIVSSLVLAFSITIYQSLLMFFISIAATFILIRLILDKKLKFFSLSFTFISVLLSSLIMVLFVNYLYAIIADKGSIVGGSYLTSQIEWGNYSLSYTMLKICKSIYDIYLGNDNHFTLALGAIIVAIIFISTFNTIKNKDKSKWALFCKKIICVLIISIAPILFDLFMGHKNPHRLYMPVYMWSFSFLAIYLLYILYNNKILRYFIVIVLTFVVIFQSIHVMNLLYSDHIRFNEDVSLTDRIISKLDSAGVNIGTKSYDLLIIGGHVMESSGVVKNDGVVTKSFYEWGEEIDSSCRVARFMNNLGYAFKTCDDKGIYNRNTMVDKLNHYKNQNLGIFPSDNSVVVDNNSLIIVRLK